MRVAFHSSVESVAQGGGGVYAVSLASALSRWHDVDLFFPTMVEREEIDRFISGRADGVHVKADPIVSTTRLIGESRKALFDLSYDIVVVQSTHVPRAILNRRGYLLCEFPFQERLAWDDRVRLRGFSRIIANSAYTARWIERLWGRTAIVLHPPVAPIAPKEKRPSILAVGRFLSGGRSKRQVEMVGMFRELYRRGLREWDLHLAGFAQDPAYVEQVRRAAAGLPVHVHAGADRAVLEELYATSSIFWHATGEGADPEREPGRMEHFGIVTAEAMSAGCVPVVFNGGGQPEIVSDESTGVLWQTFDECLEATWRLIYDRERRESFARQGIERANTFSFPVFVERVQAIFAGA